MKKQRGNDFNIKFRNAIGYLIMLYEEWNFDLIHGKRNDFKQYWEESRYFAYLNGRLDRP